MNCIARKRGGAGCSEQKKSFDVDAILAIARGASSVTYFLPQGGKLSVGKIAHLFIESGRYRHALLRCMEVEMLGEERSEDPLFCECHGESIPSSFSSNSIRARQILWTSLLAQKEEEQEDRDALVGSIGVFWHQLSGNFEPPLPPLL